MWKVQKMLRYYVMSLLCYAQGIMYAYISDFSTVWRSFTLGYVKNYVFSVEMTSLSHINEMIKQVIKGISTETLEKV